MQTITIKIKKPGALKLLEDLEAMNLIPLIKEKATTGHKLKLSERLAGCITSEQAEVMRKELTEMRNEWD